MNDAIDQLTNYGSAVPVWHKIALRHADDVLLHDIWVDITTEGAPWRKSGCGIGCIAHDTAVLRGGAGASSWLAATQFRPWHRRLLCCRHWFCIVLGPSPPAPERSKTLPQMVLTRSVGGWAAGYLENKGAAIADQVDQVLQDRLTVAIECAKSENASVWPAQPQSMLEGQFWRTLTVPRLVLAQLQRHLFPRP
ncbi:MAG: hypothetical protein ACR2PI_02835 [Hyphomicrobiaceae bacterium]